MPRKKQEKLLDAQGVAEITGLSPKTILAGKCGTADLLRVKLGKRILFVESEVMALVNAQIEAARLEQLKLKQEPEPSNVIPITRPRLITDDDITQMIEPFRKSQ